MNLLTIVRESFRDVLTAIAPDASKVPDYLAMIKPTADAKNGDYQANFAMAMSKALGKKPPELAKEIIAKLPPSDLFETPDTAGPGFINIRLKSSALANYLQQIANSPTLGIEPVANPKTFVIDYSGPNVAKPLHVGHLRSTIIGESLCRLLRFLGHKVIGDNHLGDWGTQFGILLYGFKNHLDEAAFKADPVRELARLYVHIRKLSKTMNEDGEGDDSIAIACREETAKLHAGDPENRRLWERFMPYCLAEIDAIYKRLDIHFDTQHGESFYQPMLANVVDDMIKKGIAHESEGALVIPNPKGNVPRTKEEKDKEEPPALIRKRDGAFTYTTTDLATIQYRMKEYSPTVMLYVVDFRQEFHFRTLFAQAKRWGFANTEFHHLKFGSVLGKDGKPLRTRDGDVVELDVLLDDAVKMGAQKYETIRQERIDLGVKVPDLSQEQRQEIAEVVGIGAVKYADLCQNRESNYAFDYDKMLATDGNTSTYMQYAYVRCRGIFREGDFDSETLRTNAPSLLLDSPYERALALQLLRFEEALERAAEDYAPHWLTGYLWDLAKSYSGFFVNCPVLKAPTPELKNSRLLLCDLTARTIQQTLTLLGIRTVEMM